MAERGARARLGTALAFSLAFAVAVLARWHARHQGLIYPDGYQYLLMAKGIATHLTPTLALGRGGEVFSPSIDAAIKPLYPALVAALSALTGLKTAAQALTAAGAGAVVVLVAALAQALTGSRLAAASAGLAALVSPMLGYWSGFLGPDPLAQALALACALALTRRRAAAAGVFGALCAATRPEWGVALAALGVYGLARPAWRAHAMRALTAGALTEAAVIGVLRPPLALPPGGLAGLIGLLGAGLAGQEVARRLGTSARGRLVFILACSAALAALAVSGHAPALNALLSANWPLVALALAGALMACREPYGAELTVLVAVVAVTFAAYEYRNPSSARYLSELIPVLCLFGAVAVATAVRATPRHLGALSAAAALGLTLAPMLSTPAQPAVGRDYFQTLAVWLRHAPPGPLVSAAPDAFGYLLPERAEQAIAPGARGLILLDAAEREYAPASAAVGTPLQSYVPDGGFERPDGSIDSAPARLLAGVVTR